MPKGIYTRSSEYRKVLIERAKHMPHIKKHTKESIEKIRNSKLGKKRKFTTKWINNLRKASIKAGCTPPSFKGKKWTEKQRETFTLQRKGKPNTKITGSNNGNWKGGFENKNYSIRNSLEYKFWRRNCFFRDNFTCQKTGQVGGKLVVHHINNFADFPELRFVIDNGITLSVESHKEFHKIYGKRNNTREQLSEFLIGRDKN